MNIVKKRTGMREMLIKIGAARESNIELFSSRTRDNPALNVYKDSLSGVIFIDDYYVGDEEYVSGEYRESVKKISGSSGRDYEDVLDSERRFKSYKQFIAGKDVCDFGCGAGSFLKLAKAVAKNISGIELQQDYCDSLNAAGIPCFSKIEDCNGGVDLVTLFHCLEHLPDPVSVLRQIRACINPGGKIVIEVPHAKDFLIKNLCLQDFIDFTLWSQHLVLHTRESLHLLLREAGFENILIEGVQRYSISNHISWLAHKKPGGHKSVLSVLETSELVSAYEQALAKIDSTDTLVAVASVS